MSDTLTPAQAAEARMRAVEHSLNSFSGPLDRLRELQHRADRVLAGELQALPRETQKEVAQLEAALADAERRYAAASAPVDKLERQEAELFARLRDQEKKLDAAVGPGELDGTPMSERAFGRLQSDLLRLRSALAEATDRRQRASLTRLNLTSDIIRLRRELLAARGRLEGQKAWARDADARLQAWSHPEDRITYG